MTTFEKFLIAAMSTVVGLFLWKVALAYVFNGMDKIVESFITF